MDLIHPLLRVEQELRKEVIIIFISSILLFCTVFAFFYFEHFQSTSAVEPQEMRSEDGLWMSEILDLMTKANLCKIQQGWGRLTITVRRACENQAESGKYRGQESTQRGPSRVLRTKRTGRRRFTTTTGLSFLRGRSGLRA